MKRKSVKMAMSTAAALVLMLGVYTSCEKDKDKGGGIGVNPENGVRVEQSGDSANIPEIPAGAVRENQEQEDWSQTFEIDLSDPNSGSSSHSFSDEVGSDSD